MPQRRTVEEKSTRRRAAGEDARDEQTPQDEVDDDTAEPEEPAGGHGRRGARRDADGSRLISAAAAAEAGLRSIVELTGKQPEGVTAVEPTDDGWLVGVEVVEDRRVPSSADILAMYEAELDPDGNLVSYRRMKRYSRSRGDDGGEG
jgi:Gas vesicle synthesis protein GvpO